MKKIEVTSVKFNTTIISESPTVLLLVVTGNVQHLGYNLSHKVTVDYKRLEMPLREAAVDITDNSIISGGYHKRSLRYKQQSEENKYKLQFQARCTDLKNLQGYTKVINQSIALLENVITSML